jgi:hypothetical protein
MLPSQLLKLLHLDLAGIDIIPHAFHVRLVALRQLRFRRGSVPTSSWRDEMAAAALALAKELSRKTGLRCAVVAGDGAYAVETVGGTRYQSALEALTGGRSSRGVSHKCMALLVPEPANPRDRGAVLVQISGHDVGYLSRDLARLFSRELAAAGCSAAVAAAVIVGGWNRMGGSAGQFSVKLDVVDPFRFEGAGDTPAAAGSRPSRADVDTEPTAEPTPRSSAWVVAGGRAFTAAIFLAGMSAKRFARTAAIFLAGMATRRLALAAAIFLAGMATGAGLILWLRPAIAPPVAVQPEVPVEPAAKPSTESPAETPVVAPAAAPEGAPAAVPLPRLRPDTSPNGAAP